MRDIQTIGLLGAWCAVAFFGTANGMGSCYPLQSGAHVNNNIGVALTICHPKGNILNCDHCTHAGSKTACWTLNSRCGSNSIDTRKLQNWGWSEELKQWMQNHDLRGMSMWVKSVCLDRYGGNCFTELPSPDYSNSLRLTGSLLLFVVMMGFFVT